MRVRTESDMISWEWNKITVTCFYQNAAGAMHAAFFPQRKKWQSWCHFTPGKFGSLSYPPPPRKVDEFSYIYIVIQPYIAYIFFLYFLKKLRLILRMLKQSAFRLRLHRRTPICWYSGTVFIRTNIKFIACARHILWWFNPVST